MFAARMIAAIAVLVAWIVAAVLPLGIAGWAIAFAITVIAVGLTAVYERYVARTGGVRQRDLEGVVAARVRDAVPAQQMELQALDADFREALQRVTGTIPGRTSTQSIDAAPWYLVLGPTAVGKSSLLAASGQPFAWATAASGAHGHHPCRWWLADDAVYVDTTGAWCASEAPSTAWLDLIARMEKVRPMQPIHGVIVTLAADALAAAHHDELDALARILRARLDEVAGYLGVDVPVYVAITRADSIPGIWEFFGDLGREELGQVWGATFPIGAFSNASAGDRVGGAIDELANVACARRLRRLASERDAVRRFATYQFPQWLGGLRDNLVVLTAATFARTAHQQPIFLRGVYLVTASSDPTKHDAPGGAFARDLFRSIIVPDRELAARSVAEIRRRRAVHHAIAAGLTALATLGVLLPLSAFKDSDDTISGLNTAIDGVTTHSQGPLPIAMLEALRAQVAALSDTETAGPPLHSRFGMYAGGALYPRAATLFGALTYRDVAGPVVQRRSAELEAFADRYSRITLAPTPEERTYYGDALGLYVFLTTPRMPDDLPLTDPVQRQWFNHHLALAWGQANPSGQATSWTAMTAITGLYARLLQSDARLASPRNLGLVARVRAVLAR